MCSLLKLQFGGCTVYPIFWQTNVYFYFCIFLLYALGHPTPRFLARLASQPCSSPQFHTWSHYGLRVLGVKGILDKSLLTFIKDGMQKNIKKWEHTPGVSKRTTPSYMVFVGALFHHASVSNDVYLQTRRNKQVKDISQKISDSFEA